MKISQRRVFFLFVIVLFSKMANAQYFYSFQRDTNNIRNMVTGIYKIDILSCEKEELIDLHKLGYKSIFIADVDDYGAKLFFSYNLIQNYAMIDIADHTDIVDLSRGLDNSYVDAGIDYKAAYHHPSNSLYLFWRKFDPELDNETGQIDSCAIVDPGTGKNIKAFESFFDIYSATFSEDGKRLYASKIKSIDERRQRITIKLIINSGNAEIIDSLSPSDLEPEADKVYFINIDGSQKSVGSIQLVATEYSEGDNKQKYLYAYNMDTKQKSIRIINDINGACGLSMDASKIIIDEYDPEKKQHKGVIHILDVEWLKDENDDKIMKIEDGITVHVPAPDKPKDYHSKTHSIKTFATNPDVILYYYHNKPFESSYLIRLSDGKILRKGK